MCSLLICGALPQATMESSRAAWLHGTILAPQQDAVIPGISVDVSAPSGEHVCETRSNAEGKFSCQLPPGVYFVSTRRGNFLPYHRAAIRLNAGDGKHLIVRPVPGAPSDQETIPEPKLKYEVRSVLGTEVAVQFEKSVWRADSVTFRGEHLMLTVVSHDFELEFRVAVDGPRVAPGRASGVPLIDTLVKVNRQIELLLADARE